MNLLNQFYKRKGFYNIKIKSSYATLKKNNNFDLLFTIDAGNKFYFNDFSLNLSNEYSKENFNELDNLFKKFKNDEYSIKSINEIKDFLDSIALRKEFVFIDSKFEEIIVGSNKINVNFYLDELEKSYVDRINIFGNFITEEKL